MYEKRIDRLFPRPAFIKEVRKAETNQRFIIEIASFIVFFLVYFKLTKMGGAYIKTMDTTAWPVGSPEAIINFLNFIGIAGAIACCWFIEKRRPRGLGYVKAGLGGEYLVGIATGFIGFVACVGFGMLAGVVKINGLMPDIAWGGILFLFVSYMVQGMTEEVITRGYLMVTLSQKLPIWASAGISAAFFSLAHIKATGLSFLPLFNIFIIGVFLALVILRRGSIWMAAGFHTAWNFTQGNLFGFSVSGHEKSAAILSAQIAEGNPILTGGSFGLEASIFTTLTAMVLIIIVFLVKPIDRSAKA